MAVDREILWLQERRNVKDTIDRSTKEASSKIVTTSHWLGRLLDTDCQQMCRPGLPAQQEFEMQYYVQLPVRMLPGVASEPQVASIAESNFHAEAQTIWAVALCMLKE